MKRENILVDLLKHPDSAICTCFQPVAQSMSSVKKWIAHSDSFAKGALHVNEATLEAIRSERAASILPVGVTCVEGVFEKDDIVRILDGAGRQVAVGKSNLSSEETAKALGKHGQKPIVHYDYLYLDQYEGEPASNL